MQFYTNWDSTVLISLSLRYASLKFQYKFLVWCKVMSSFIFDQALGFDSKPKLHEKFFYFWI